MNNHHIEYCTVIETVIWLRVMSVRRKRREKYLSKKKCRKKACREKNCRDFLFGIFQQNRLEHIRVENL